MNTIYTRGVIESLELGWSQGWLSPGGDQELQLLLDGIEIKNKTIPDIWTGTGGPALSLLGKVICGLHTSVPVKIVPSKVVSTIGETRAVLQIWQKAKANSDKTTF
jgi:hypothetical protein